MKCYFDTSAIVKCYVDEQYSDKTKRALREAETVATSRVAYAETRAAFGQIYRNECISSEEFQELVNDFSADWPNYLVKDVTESVTQRAGRLADQCGLRGFDAIHLSTALYFDDLFEVNLSFLAYDDMLNDGAERNGFDLLHEL